MDRINRLDEVHSRLGEASECCVGLAGEVHHPGDHHRRGAIFQQVNFLREFHAFVGDLVEQVAYGPGDAVALCLSRYDDRIELEQFLDEPGISPAYGVAFVIGQNLGLED